MMQWYGLITGRGDGTVAVLFWFGTLGAIAAAVMGWMYAYDFVYFGDDEQLLLWHRWLGTGTAVIAVVLALSRKRLSPKALALALTICAGLVAAAAPFSASLVYGADFFKFNQACGFFLYGDTGLLGRFSSKSIQVAPHKD